MNSYVITRDNYVCRSQHNLFVCSFIRSILLPAFDGILKIMYFPIIITLHFLTKYGIPTFSKNYIIKLDDTDKYCLYKYYINTVPFTIMHHDFNF